MTHEIRCEYAYDQKVRVWVPDGKLLHPAPILALHGNWATCQRYTKYGPWFADRGYLFVAPTFRHHYHANAANAHLGCTSIRDYAQDIEKMIERLTRGSLIDRIRMPAPPILMGHSMGGTVAQLVASRQKLSALILINSAPVAGVSLHTDRRYQRRILPELRSILGGRPYLPSYSTMAEYVYNGMPADIRPNLYHNAAHESGAATREILAGSGSVPVRWLARLFSNPIAVGDYDITCPMLIIGCKKDRIIPPTVAEDLTTKYCDRAFPTRLHLFDQFAHWPQYEPGWDASAQYILDWLQET